MKKLSLVILFVCFGQIILTAQCPDSLYIKTQAQIDSFQINYPGCTEIEGNVTIGSRYSLRNITNLYGLSEITRIKGYLMFISNDSLEHLTGLENLTNIEGSLMFGSNMVGGNASLLNMQGLDNLEYIGGGLLFNNNKSLRDLSGLENLKFIGGSLTIGFRTCFPGGNLALISIEALSNLDSLGTSLRIEGNYMLSNCAINAICGFLDSATLGNIIIAGNGTGCDSYQEVKTACENFSIKEYYADDFLSLYPNPACQELNISTDDGREVDEVKIYTLTGQQVLKARLDNGILDISHLQSGMYIVEVTIENTRLRKKLLVQR